MQDSGAAPEASILAGLVDESKARGGLSPIDHSLGAAEVHSHAHLQPTIDLVFYFH